jgi:hypothetical protein
VTPLADEFPGWEIAVRPAGLDVITALWRSSDGHSRRSVVAHSAPELAERLREIGTLVGDQGN